jgi:hypothetical protein
MLTVFRRRRFQRIEPVMIEKTLADHEVTFPAAIHAMADLNQPASRPATFITNRFNEICHKSPPHSQTAKCVPTGFEEAAVKGLSNRHPLRS